RVDARRCGHRAAHCREHLLREREVEEGVDEKGRLTVDHEARVAQSPAAVGLHVGEQPVAPLGQALLIAARQVAHPPLPRSWDEAREYPIAPVSPGWSTS